MSAKKNERFILPFSVFNLVFLALLVLAIIAALGRAQYGFAGILTAFLLVTVFVIGRVKRLNASDVQRLNAAENLDERDKNIAARSLAVVGMVSLWVVFAVCLSNFIYGWSDRGTTLLIGGVTAASYALWGVCNWYFARKM